jgi:uncharacterized protein
VISLDTNLLFPSVNEDNPNYLPALAFVQSLKNRKDVVISEFILLELYVLLRNPVAQKKPLSADAAVDLCDTFRQHPHWQVVGFPPNSRSFHDQLWPRLREKYLARRRAYDWRTAFSLLSHGVTEFATVNLKDFQDFGFARVWNPLEGEE